MTYEQFLAALCLWREGRGQSKAALAGVLAVIHNRMLDEKNRWPKSVPGVVTQPFQFSSFNASDPNVTKFPMPPIGAIPESLDWGAWLDCCSVVEGFSVLSADPTGGSNMYHSYPEGSQWTPAWALPSRHTVDIGPFHFFKL